MSTFEDERYQWRETYFILFEPSKRPFLESIRRELELMFHSLKIRSFQADEHGRIEMLSVASFEDSAAIDIMFQSGEQVLTEMDALAKELAQLTTTMQSLEKIEKAKQCSARLDVLHFEQMLPVEPDFSYKPQVLEDAFEEENDVKPGKTPFTRRSKFQFDPEQYIPPPSRQQFVFEDSDEQLDEFDEEIQEELDPNTLILVLETLCRLTEGVAIDPASGTVF